MSRLDEIYDQMGINQGEAVPATASEFREGLTPRIKILMLDLFVESLKESGGDVGKLADKFTEKVKGL